MLMKIRNFGLTAIALVALVQSAAANAPPLAEAWNGPAIAWRDIGLGIREATATRKTMIMVFHAPWCTACGRYRTVFKDARIVEASKSFVMVLIDADKDKAANGAFAPDGTYVPRTLFLTPDGDVRSDLVSKSDPEHPHSLDVDNADELLALMLRAAGGEGGSSEPPAPSPASPDQRAQN